MCAWLPACLSVYFSVYVRVFVYLAGNTIYALLYRGPKTQRLIRETHQTLALGGIDSLGVDWSRSLVPWVTPAPHNAQFHPHPSLSLAILYDY